MRFAIVSAALMAMGVFGQDAPKSMQSSDCSSCHAADHQVVGPAYADMAKRHAGEAGAADKLSAKIREGGGGMTPHPALSDAERSDIAKWILSQTGSSQTASRAAPADQTFSYTQKDGSTVQLDFPMFIDSRGPKVTKDVFHGYQLYNSYCYRCHGTDATGGQLGPDLRRSLMSMKQPDFLSVAMTGRKEQGMPSWAGFLSEKDVVDIYKYVKGRSLDLVPSGRPASEQD